MSDTLPPREWFAPAGAVWVCIACGKWAQVRDKVGEESCFMNAILASNNDTLKLNGAGRVLQCDTFYRCRDEAPPTLR